MPELLLELLSEEIPARMQWAAAAELERCVTTRLTDAGLAFASARSYATPRRLALVVEGLPSQQPDRREERKGPKVGAAAAAIEGFVRASALSSIEEAEVRDTDKGQVYFAVRKVAGRPTSGVLAELLPAAVEALVWPKSMRWGRHRFRWVRPLRQVLAVFDGKPLEGGLSLGGTELPFVGHTVGHRFLAPDPFPVSDAAAYAKGLEAAKVIIDQDLRRQRILEQSSALAHEAGLAVSPDSALLDEVTGLVEWPVVLAGRISPSFMDLPEEVLTSSMRRHQKYFSLVAPDGRLADLFFFVTNMEAPEGSPVRANVIAGNERVLKARLADAKFFWEQDQKHSLASRVPALANMVFHAKLGTLEEKTDRIEALAVELAWSIPGAEVDRVRSAARLAKADLTSGMVGEFPELQGVMGRYYALADGEHAEVADAIAEHYAPVGPSDDCPSAAVSVAVALADKLDTLAGLFGIGERPTGSKDPYGLRRAALGVIRLILENRLRLSLKPLFERAARNYRGLGLEAKELAEELVAFLAERLKVALRDRGVRHDLIAAVFAARAEDDLLRLLARVEALSRLLAEEDGANLLVAYRRAANIVRIEARKDGKAPDGPLDKGALLAAEEKALAEALQSAAEAAEEEIAREDFASAMRALATLRAPVDAFFDKVTVNSDDPRLRENRLRLLAALGGTLDRVADFSQIEG